MKIECLTEAGKSKKLILIVDGEEDRTLSPSIFGYKLTINAANVAELEEQLLKLEQKGARNYAARCLARQALPREKLFCKLQKEGVRQEVIEEVLEDLEQKGYINDRDWALGFVARLKRQKSGPGQIRQKLREKGIPKELIDEALAGEDSADGIQALLETRYKNRDLGNPKEKQKVIGALVRKGYRLDDIFRIIKEL